MILDTSIGYNESNSRVQERFESNIVKELNMSLEFIITLFG